jgi:multidrug resistance efflux pump
MEKEMKKNMLTQVVLVLIVLSVYISGCDSLNGQSTNQLFASGTIAANDVKISSEIGGTVIDIAVKEGDVVASGDILFHLDDEIVQAQYNQAEAAVEVANAAVSAAQTQLDNAKLQYEITLQAARVQDTEARAAVWQTPQFSEIELPTWYFVKDEKIAAAQAEVEFTEERIEEALANLEDDLSDSSSSDFIEAEERLANAQVAFTNAAYVLEQAKAALDNDELERLAQEAYDAALAELEASQLEYDRLLTTAEAEEVLEARAKVALVQALYDHAVDTLIRLQTGEDALQVEVAFLNIFMAETALEQAEAGLSQAEAALNLLEIQIKKTIVYAPMDGIIFSRNLEIGETVAPGVPVMLIGQLKDVELVVYIPEAQYGKISLGQGVSIAVDSFPGETFTGKVVHISDQAEFTPRNIQTEEGRRATVYAVKLQVPNPEGKLKPGMPADVIFNINQ